jgi:hypothetical protein
MAIGKSTSTGKSTSKQSTIGGGGKHIDKTGQKGQDERNASGVRTSKIHGSKA